MAPPQRPQSVSTAASTPFPDERSAFLCAVVHLSTFHAHSLSIYITQVPVGVRTRSEPHHLNECAPLTARLSSSSFLLCDKLQRVLSLYVPVVSMPLQRSPAAASSSPTRVFSTHSNTVCLIACAELNWIELNWIELLMRERFSRHQVQMGPALRIRNRITDACARITSTVYVVCTSCQRSTRIRRWPAASLPDALLARWASDVRRFCRRRLLAVRIILCALLHLLPIENKGRKTEDTSLIYSYAYSCAALLAQFVARLARDARRCVQRAARARRQVSRLIPAALTARTRVWSSRLVCYWWLLACYKLI